MKVKNQKLVVEQFDNPKYVSPQYRVEGNSYDETEYIYRVVQAVNVLDPPVGSKLTPKQLQRLIDDGINVTINVPK